MAELADVTANMTLEEIRKRCIDNFYLLSHDFKDYTVNHQLHAFNLLSQLQQMGLRKLGVKALDKWEETIKANPKFLKDEVALAAYGKQLDKQMKDHGVKLERIVHGTGYRMMMTAKQLEKGGAIQSAESIKAQAQKEGELSPEDMARTGTYFFKGKWEKLDDGEDYFIYDEIAYFASDPIVLDASRLWTEAIVLPGQVKFLIRSNIRI